MPSDLTRAILRVGTAGVYYTIVRPTKPLLVALLASSYVVDLTKGPQIFESRLDRGIDDALKYTLAASFFTFGVVASGQAGNRTAEQFAFGAVSHGFLMAAIEWGGDLIEGAVK